MLHFNRLIGPGAFLRDSGIVQHGAQPERGSNTVFFQLSGPRPVSSTLVRQAKLVVSFRVKVPDGKAMDCLHKV
ncbi:MAG: hypothetical protein PHD43_05995 [Methylococcales bacterium]|nr:hypothetical protein [Methylococcales bacterium]